MIVEQIWTASPLRNFNYLVACGQTGDALAIDPLDFKTCLAVAERNGWQITQVLNTHEHRDHIGGNKGMIDATGARLLAHQNAGKRIPNVDRGLAAGDVIQVGETVELTCLDTPGHTMSHICLFRAEDQPALFSGDTLFNAGAGNCHNGGHPEELYETFATQLDALPSDTRLFPGHDYLVTNLRFSLDREPDNQAAQAMLDSLIDHDPANARVTTLGEEKTFNPFFRLSSPGIIENLAASHPQIDGSSGPKAVFLALRELRNRW